MPVTPRQSDAFRDALLAWFDAHRRDLPWRADRDPYRIWLSEVMLQQTQVATVVPHFARFLARFPTLAHLAAADEQDVLHQWQGLGYYRRARNLHAAAKQLHAAFPDGPPDDPAAWDALPGVGPYIKGAVLSQAFERRLPIVEANTVRVLCRLFGQDGDTQSGTVKKWLWAAAEAILPSERVGDFNQAMMELGALVCTPDAPKCATCPVAASCEARRLNAQARIPAPKARTEITAVREVAVIVRQSSGDVLLVRRPDAGRWSRMWEFPRAALAEGDTHEAAADRLLSAVGVAARLRGEWASVKHGVTRYRVTLSAWAADYESGEFAPGLYPEGRWLAPDRLADFPVSTPQRKLAERVRANAPSQGHLFGDS